MTSLERAGRNLRSARKAEAAAYAAARAAALEAIAGVSRRLWPRVNSVSTA